MRVDGVNRAGHVLSLQGCARSFGTPGFSKLSSPRTVPKLQVPVLRLVAESLGESTCEAIERGHARNLASIHLTHLREEEEVQVGF